MKKLDMQLRDLQRAAEDARSSPHQPTLPKKTMTKIKLLLISMLAMFGLIAAQQQSKHEPMTFALNCPGGDCPLLKGAPQTSGMRGGSVKLKPGDSVGWHSTSANEEALVILHGSGVAKIEAHADVPLAEKMLAYIPPATRHNVTNTGTEVLEYVWIVAPAGAAH
ncbi:MAG TPA: cupin domain-containing protein [Terriglobales bacterium]|nr:cupin domain-containing protein [Terriglobales bacterium]